ncbi:hypothetical protein [Thalassolituus oleivorans]|uniref:hypothetical protein n=1 Tax=Thalassolituus oleivorans TaxID=187493 RepID=UPI00240A5362|nr:hypothetical protein [Thalassolituus oleivorans]MDF1641264.1 hypothetical protein [Thalassolituus oleivorans]
MIFLFFVIFPFFIFVYKGVFEFGSFSSFKMAYRDGLLSGSGIYTFPILKILSVLLISLIVIYKKVLDGFIIISMILFLIAVSILGLRVFLFPLVFVLMALMIYKQKISGFIFFSAAFLLFLVVSKYVIYKDLDRPFLDAVMNPFLRQNFQALLMYKWSGDNEGLSIFCMFAAVNSFLGCGPEEWKYSMYGSISGFKNLMPMLGNYSGIAIPMPVYLYNEYGYLGIPLNVFYYLIGIGTWCLAWSSRHYIIIFFSLTVSLGILGSVLEDISTIGGVIFNLLGALLAYSSFCFAFLGVRRIKGGVLA